jgi:hypothetical protein
LGSILTLLLANNLYKLNEIRDMILRRVKQRPLFAFCPESKNLDMACVYYLYSVGIVIYGLVVLEQILRMRKPEK